jgi:agmatine/peptidylarginine deiminase
MSWNALSTQDVLNEFTAAEQAVLQNIQPGSNELAAILDKTVKRVRSMIKAGGNPLDQTGLTIPDQLAEETVAIARWSWLNSFPALKTLKTPERAEAAKQANLTLKEIATNKPERPRVELPAVPDTTSAPTNSVATARRGRRLHTDSFDRLAET